MKLRLLFLFIILCVLTVVSVFYVKNYFFYKPKAAQVQQIDLTAVKTAEIIEENIASLKSYTGANFDLAEVSSLEAYDKLIVHFWASWCDPCVNEIPELLDYLKRNAADVQAKKLQIVLVSLDYDLESINKFLKSFPGLNSPEFIQVWDPDSILQNSYNIDRLPSTFIFHKEKPMEKYLTVVDWRLM